MEEERHSDDCKTTVYWGGGYSIVDASDVRSGYEKIEVDGISFCVNNLEYATYYTPIDGTDKYVAASVSLEEHCNYGMETVTYLQRLEADNRETLVKVLEYLKVYAVKKSTSTD